MNEHDEVNNPAHYDLFEGQQAIDVIRAALTPSFLNAEHQKMLKRFEKEGVWCAGWIACPYDMTIDNKLADTIYTNINAWEKTNE